MRLFKPDIELEVIKPKPLPPRYVAYKGEVARIVLGTIRDAKRPCSTQELTMHVLAERGMNTVDKGLVRTVGSSLRRARGLIQSIERLGGRIAWE